jgi:predicted ATP-binding protein involved in virulence
MRIFEVGLRNFRCFEAYSLRLARRFSLLIGENGSGKTAMLDALAVAAGSFLLGIPEATSRPINGDELRAVNLAMGQSVTRESIGETEVFARGEIDGLDLQWKRTLRSANARTTRQFASKLQQAAKILVERAKEGTPTTFPVLAFYGTGRLWKNLNESKGSTNGVGSRYLGYKDCLNPASDQKRLLRWFKTNEMVALQKRQKRLVLEAVRASIVAMIPGATNAFWDLEWDELTIDVTIDERDQRLPFHLLSDGYRNVVGIAADIGYRMATLNPQLLDRVTAETPGIVLVDEIDLHLHPNWQRKVVGHLLRAFPQVQFVATTHSPFIIQSLHGLDDSLLWDLGTRQPLALETKSIEDIAEEKQGVEIPQQSQRFLDMMQAAERYYALLREAHDVDSHRLEQLKRELDRLSLPYSDQPAFQAFLSQERYAAGLNGSGDS